MGAYLIWTTKAGQTGVLRFDAVLSERHQMSSMVTEHPVERGANITDHVRAELDSIDLEVSVSNTPLDGDDRFKEVGAGGQLGAIAPLKLDVKPWKDPSGYLALLGEIGDLVSRQKEFSAQVLQFDIEQNLISQTYAVLRSLRDTAQLIKVVTPMWDYENMVITRVEMPRTSTDSGKFQLSLKQIRLVETRRTAEPVPTEVRGKKAKNKGAKGPTTPPEQNRRKTIAKKMKDVVSGFLGGD